jgi:hypothetical protein
MNTMSLPSSLLFRLEHWLAQFDESFHCAGFTSGETSILFAQSRKYSVLV